jgi:hypothetical protein
MGDWFPTRSIWNEAERKARAQRKEVLDSIAYRVISDQSMSALRAEVILLAEHRRKHGAAQSTIDALMYSLRRGLSALGPFDPLQKDTLRRVSELSKEQLKACCGDLQKRKPPSGYAGGTPLGQAWTETELRKLVLIWKGAHK